MDIEEKREELAQIKPELRYANEALTKARKIYEQCFSIFNKLKKRHDQLEYQIAEEDGRLKKLAYGKSGKSKSKKGGEPKLSLQDYIQTLSPAAKEAFIKELLNPQPEE